MNYEITVTLPTCFAPPVSRFLGQLFSSLVHVIYDNLTSLFHGLACFAGADIFIPKTAKQGGWLYYIIVLFVIQTQEFNYAFSWHFPLYL